MPAPDSGLKCEAAGMAGKIHQNMNTVILDQLGKIIRGQLTDIDKTAHGAAHLGSDGIILPAARITDDLEILLVMGGQHVTQKKSYGVRAEIRRQIGKIGQS